jgi:hypothetical protein
MNEGSGKKEEEELSKFAFLWLILEHKFLDDLSMNLRDGMTLWVVMKNLKGRAFFTTFQDVGQICD